MHGSFREARMSDDDWSEAERLSPAERVAAEALIVDVDGFEGPLDLLLFLIRKAEIDIYDIPIEKVTQQYLEILRTQEKDNLELAGDFFVMAATLMYIKSRMLLPRPGKGRGRDAAGAAAGERSPGARRTPRPPRTPTARRAAGRPAPPAALPMAPSSSSSMPGASISISGASGISPISGASGISGYIALSTLLKGSFAISNTPCDRHTRSVLSHNLQDG